MPQVHYHNNYWGIQLNTRRLCQNDATHRSHSPNNTSVTLSTDDLQDPNLPHPHQENTLQKTHMKIVLFFQCFIETVLECIV